MRSARAVLPGHPDALCDLVAEAVVDEYVRRDPETRIHLRVMGGHGALFIAGEVASTADFDVAALATRVAGAMGAAGDLAPFVSIEPAAAEQVQRLRCGIGAAVEIMGYATDEAPERLPLPVVQAQRLARRLAAYREEADGFWLGPDAEAFVSEDAAGERAVSLNVEHGGRNVHEARRILAEVLATELDGARLRVNDAGANERRGLAKGVGASGQRGDVYGSRLPAMAPMSGLDPRHPLKAGPWLARALARDAVSRGAKAAWVQAVYHPGEPQPALVRVRDEGGREIARPEDVKALRLDRVAAEWWRDGLGMDAARWGFVGGAALPWEV
jgi:S-adenosylmethionine synthetase